MTGKPRLLFYFLHLLGVGHVHRAERLISGLAARGIIVDAVWGGDPVPGMQLKAESVHYLPPIRAADNAYSKYLDVEGHPLGAAFLSKRKDMLLKAFAGMEPDVVMLEAFPFGRRMVRKELLGLLDAVTKRNRPPVVVSSVRDILQEKRKAGRAEETRDIVRHNIDHVLVHSDPGIIKLDATFPLADAIRDKITYTGFVVPPVEGRDPASRFDIIVSAGGGAFGGELMETALRLAAVDPFPGLTWCLATGPNLDETSFRELCRAAGDHVTVVRHLDHLAGYLAVAKLSVSQCGYNTAMDVLSVHRTSACRAVFVPYDTEGQTEQLRRSELLDKAGYAVNLPHSHLTPERLGNAMARAFSLKRVERPINFDGVERTAAFVSKIIEERRSS